MKKYLYFILVLTFTLIFSSTLLAAVPSADQKKLWAELVEAKANPSSSRLGKWNAIEGMSLIKKVDDVSLKAAALATIIHYYDAKEKIWIGEDNPNERFLTWSKKNNLTDDESKKIAEKYIRHINDLYDEPKEASKGFKDHLTAGVDVSRAIEKYLKRNRDNIARAARDFATNRGLDVEVLTRDNFRFDELANFIDHKNPIILQQTTTDNYLICVGYIRQSTEEYLITVDLNKLMFAEISRADLVVGKGKWARSEREISKNEDQRFGLMKGDKKIKLIGDISPGIEITDYRPGSYTAFVIKDFKLTEASFEKYMKFLKEK